MPKPDMREIAVEEYGWTLSALLLFHIIEWSVEDGTSLVWDDPEMLTALAEKGLRERVASNEWAKTVISHLDQKRAETAKDSTE